MKMQFPASLNLVLVMSPGALSPFLSFIIAPTNPLLRIAI
jgi:hypothetical protein